MEEEAEITETLNGRGCYSSDGGFYLILVSFCVIKIAHQEL